MQILCYMKDRSPQLDGSLSWLCCPPCARRFPSDQRQSQLVDGTARFPSAPSAGPYADRREFLPEPRQSQHTSKAKWRSLWWAPTDEYLLFTTNQAVNSSLKNRPVRMNESSHKTGKYLGKKKYEIKRSINLQKWVTTTSRVCLPVVDFIIGFVVLCLSAAETATAAVTSNWSHVWWKNKPRFVERLHAWSGREPVGYRGHKPNTPTPFGVCWQMRFNGLSPKLLYSLCTLICSNYFLFLLLDQIKTPKKKLKKFLVGFCSLRHNGGGLFRVCRKCKSGLLSRAPEETFY